MFQEFVVKMASEAVYHELFHGGFDAQPFTRVRVCELDSHSRLFPGFFFPWAYDPLNTTCQLEGFVQCGNVELENKFCINIEWFLCFYKCAASADIFGVVREKRIEASIFDFELDRRSRTISLFGIFFLVRQFSTCFFSSQSVENRCVILFSKI